MSLAHLLTDHRGARGEVRLQMPLPDGGAATLLIGRDFLLDAELVTHIEHLPGVVSVEMKTSEARLALVG